MVREQLKVEYEKITQEINKLEGQREGIVQSMALIDAMPKQMEKVKCGNLV